MGISGQPEQLLDISSIKDQKVPVIKRFSGGGTVIVDETTLFVTFILAKNDTALHPFPEPILRWSADLYASAWKIPLFHLRENDYVIGEKKCGGNAQYIKKDRWIHHTSFLWDYRPENMKLLLMPQKRPTYRGERKHSEFLCRLKNFGSDPKTRLSQIEEELVKQFYIEPFDLNGWEEKPHRQSTRLIEL